MHSEGKEPKTFKELEEELREYYTTNAQGKHEHWASHELRDFIYKEQWNDKVNRQESERRDFKAKLPAVLAGLSEKVIGIITKWPARFSSPHEALSVLEEEVHELRMEVYKNEKDVSTSRLLEEAKDIAAVAIRIIVENTPDHYRR